MGKACLKESCGFFFPPTVTLHTSTQAELRVPLGEIQKGQKSLFHTFTSLHTPACARAYVPYSTNTLKHTRTLPGTRLLPSGHTVGLQLHGKSNKKRLDFVQM